MSAWVCNKPTGLSNNEEPCNFFALKVKSSTCIFRVIISIMYRSNRSFNTPPPPPGIPRAFDCFNRPRGGEFNPYPRCHVTCLGACMRHDKSWRRSTEGVSGILNSSMCVKLEIPRANTGGVLGYVFYSRTEQF